MLNRKGSRAEIKLRKLPPIPKALMKSRIILIYALLLSNINFAQETFPVNGTVEKEVIYTAFKNAVIHIDEDMLVESATLLIKGDEIVAVGKDVELPKNCVVHDLSGKHIYPGFIDLYTSVGMPKVERPKWEPRPQYESNRTGAFGWNQALRSDTQAAELFELSEQGFKEYRELGFTSVLSHQHDGISRGTGTLLFLSDDTPSAIIEPLASSHFSFKKGSSRQSYPSSLMGSIALLRQFLLDAEWYEKGGENKETNLVLKAINEQKELPWIFEVDDKWSIFRADKIADEFNKQIIVKGVGDEYQRAKEIAEVDVSLIIPLNFPMAYDMSDPFLSRLVSLNEMRHWELAPSNAVILDSSGVEFSFTLSDLKKKSEFYKNLRKAVDRGLSKRSALAALTSRPAKILGQEDRIGALREGYKAGFSVWSDELFSEEAELLETWVGDKRYQNSKWNEIKIDGEYNLTIDKTQYRFIIEGQKKLKAEISFIDKKSKERDTLSTEAKITQNGHLVNLSFQLEEGPQKGVLRLAGNIHSESRIWDGKAQLEDGKWVEWVAVRQAAEQVSESTVSDSLSASPEKKIEKELGAITYPLHGYGWEEFPEDEVIHIKNATVWTCEAEGIIEDGQVLIGNGKILGVGKTIDMNNLFPKSTPDIKVIDAKGKHVTPGIIDEHSHIAIYRGVNESGQASSAEVSISDVIYPDDVNIYRQLAGGVTAAQLLHGSANPIGGQSGIIKMRWGKTAEEMNIDYAAPFIKFALGENVKQSNWGDFQTERFPQTRMGVEQVFYDYFHRAREYETKWKDYEKTLSNLSRRQKRKGDVPPPPRKDLELEALLQILNRERFVSCHSYQQGEINMLMHVADSMGFTLNTFTHILEGYKVADKMAEHGAGGSSFSDWWAYKFEVKDAIPYNGAILWENGVTTAFNSDDAEMARRLNQEAAKAVKYGGVPEEEALKFVTLNPAKLLHLDDRTGSLKEGKDADLVIWSDHPLSIYAKAEKTFVDGICYFDLDRDKELRDKIRSERSRIAQKMLGAKEKGEPTKAPEMKPEKRYHCNSIEGQDHEGHEH